MAGAAGTCSAGRRRHKARGRGGSPGGSREPPPPPAPYHHHHHRPGMGLEPRGPLRTGGAWRRVVVGREGGGRTGPRHACGGRPRPLGTTRGGPRCSRTRGAAQDSPPPPLRALPRRGAGLSGRALPPPGGAARAPRGPCGAARARGVPVGLLGPRGARPRGGAALGSQAPLPVWGGAGPSGPRGAAPAPPGLAPLWGSPAPAHTLSPPHPPTGAVLPHIPAAPQAHLGWGAVPGDAQGMPTPEAHWGCSCGAGIQGGGAASPGSPTLVTAGGCGPAWARGLGGRATAWGREMRPSCPGLGGCTAPRPPPGWGRALGEPCCLSTALSSGTPCLEL